MSEPPDSLLSRSEDGDKLLSEFVVFNMTQKETAPGEMLNWSDHGEVDGD